MWRRRSAAGVLAGAALAAVALSLPAISAADPVIKRGSVGGRVYLLYVPPDVAQAPAEASPRPLVIALHGCWQTPEDFVTTARLDAAADRRGVLVLVPAQGRRDNPSRCWNWFVDVPGGGPSPEVVEILKIVAEVGRAYPVDRDRVVVIGFSAGGYMAVNVACAGAAWISGVGVVAGGPYRCGRGPVGAVDCMRGLGLNGEAAAAACRATMGPHARPLRASLWHGAEDPVVSPANLTALTTMFGRLAGLAAPKAEPGLPVRYRDAQGRPVVEAWLIEGMGHAWSGGDARGTHAYPPGPGATDAMLDFLLSRE